MQRLLPLKTFLENLPGQIRDQRVDRLVQDQSHGSVLVVIEHQDHGPSKNRSVELRGGDEKMALEGLHVFARRLRELKRPFEYVLFYRKLVNRRARICIRKECILRFRQRKSGFEGDDG